MSGAPAATQSPEPDLIVRREGSCGVIRLNRPKAINAVTLEMFRDVDKALDAFEADPAVAVILLEGAGERGLGAGGALRGVGEACDARSRPRLLPRRRRHLAAVAFARRNWHVFWVDRSDHEWSGRDLCAL